MDRVGQQLGHYRLLRLLGQGAYATVYLGEHRYLERLAAIKVLHVLMEEGTHKSFLHEASTIAQLRHPHIISVHDFGFEGQTPYLVMEYIQGGTLRSRYPKGTLVPFEQILAYVKQIASALDYAHEKRVMHRDVRPENILLNAKHEVVLSDFGIAVVQSTLGSLSTQSLLGTPVYMAPEQIQHKPCAASDQYALGVMVYEWLCGEPPFHDRLFEVFSQHLLKPPPSLCARLPHLPPAVEDAVFGALAKDPQYRFSTVQDFAMALEEAFGATQPLSLNRSVADLEKTTIPLSLEDLESQREEEVQFVSHLSSKAASFPIADEERSLLILSNPPLLPIVRSSFYRALGKVLSIFGFNNGALMAYEHALLLEPYRSHLYMREGEVLFNLKRYKEALAAFDEAIRLAPRSSKAYRGRGKTYEQLAQQSYDEFKRRAQQSYEKAKELGTE